MNTEEIEKFVETNAPAKNGGYVKIKFKQRQSIYGLFVKDADYSYLKSKNFWRIIPQTQLDAFKNSKDMKLAKIFNGAEFSKLSTHTESFEE